MPQQPAKGYRQGNNETSHGKYRYRIRESFKPALNELFK
jgi:hypothetical protein